VSSHRQKEFNFNPPSEKEEMRPEGEKQFTKPFQIKKKTNHILAGQEMEERGGPKVEVDRATEGEPPKALFNFYKENSQPPMAQNSKIDYGFLFKQEGNELD